MGRAGCCGRGAERLLSPRLKHRPPPLLLLILALCLHAHLGGGQPPSTHCRIQKCTGDFVSLTIHRPPALDGFDVEYCTALRSYSACTQRTAKACRGNLVFHSAVLGISDLMSQRNCSRDGPTSATSPEETHEPCNYHSRTQHAHAHGHAHGHGHGQGQGQGHPHSHSHSHSHSQAAPGYLFCGLFGDPHLRTFKDSFQTCKVEGAWPLIDNDYLSVQVTNVPVATGSSATATNKITVIFKPYQGCTEQKVYQAVTDELPAAFMDGSLSSGEPGAAAANAANAADPDAAKLRALWISERSPGRHVELHAGYIGVTVIVRQLGRYLTMAVRIPEEMAAAYDASQDLQLCLNGCPAAERIDRGGHLALPPPPSSGPPARPPPRHQTAAAARRGGGGGGGGGAPRALDAREARERCGEELEERDVYYHSCVFDLLTTGDANFTAAAHSARKDMESLHPHRDRWRIYPPRGHAPPAAAPPQPVARLALLLLCWALCSAALV